MIESIDIEKRTIGWYFANNREIPKSLIQKYKDSVPYSQIYIAFNEIHEIQSKQRFQLARELRYRQRLTTEENKLGEKLIGFLTDSACAQKNYAKQVVKTARMFGIITYQQEINLISWITSWE